MPGRVRSLFPPGPAGIACAGAWVGALVFYALFIARSAFEAEGRLTFSLFDDAMISLTYARNLAAGDGLVWMPGEPPVEGYTNFLWTLVMVPPHLAGLPDRLTALPIMVLGAVLLAATSLLAMRIAQRLSHGSFAPWVALAAAAFSFPLLFWTLRGLEVGLLAFLVMSACLLALRLAERPSTRDSRLLCCVLVAAVLTRMDAVVFIAVILGFLALSSPAAQRAAWLGGIATVATLAAHTTFRLIYYGALLPNTYYLKLAGHLLSERLERGSETLFALVSTTLWGPVCLVLALVAVRRSSLDRGTRLLVAIVAAAMAYSVSVGGDAWEWAGFANRYVSVALPALFVLAALGIEASLDAARRMPGLRSARVRIGVGTLAGLLLIASANLRTCDEWVVDGGLHVHDDADMVRRALAIRSATPPQARIAVVWAGAIPYFARRPSIDLLGKSDPVIAHLPARGLFYPGHDKWDYAYSIGQRKPDLVVQLWSATPRDRRQLEDWGYERVGEYWVRAGAEIDRSKLLREP